MLQVGCGHNNRHAFALELAHQFRQAMRERRGNAFERLIQKEKPGAAHERAAEARELLLAAGELEPLAWRELPELWNQAIDFFESLARVGDSRGPGGHQDVLLDGQIGNQAAVFGHVADAQARASVSRHCEEIVILKAHRAGAALHQAHDASHQRGLAGAVAPDEASHVAGRQRERDASENLHRLDRDVEVLELKHETPRPPRGASLVDRRARCPAPRRR